MRAGNGEGVPDIHANIEDDDALRDVWFMASSSNSHFFVALSTRFNILCMLYIALTTHVESTS